MNNNNLPTSIDDNDDAHLEVPPPRAPGPVRRDAGRAQEARMHPYNQGQGVRNPNRLSLQTIRDTMNYTDYRQANMMIRNGADLTLTELYNISTILRSLAAIMDTPATAPDFERFLAVGILSQNHPLSAQKIKAGVTPDGQKIERRAGQPIYFGLVGLNSETGVVDWAWRDKKNAGVNPQYVHLDHGQTSITIRTQAMLQYDNVERDRIRAFNSSLVTNCARRVIQKWAQVDTALDPVIDNIDRPFGLMPLQLSGPTIIAEGERLIEAGRAYTAQSQIQHTLFR
ncbi:uncharacterized protein B0J16DRAFT_405894 [Fusarium flagelliforme]|uniref:uncharacterized protein n=1 Tax=Fusarium flagelliforme TaxID=2675880 RepID=UPI001E8CA6CC|nr:uncharacterized protein B0J16DRAFT_405894 [Fusarium flagelliforme]KAH7173533.1 hypothetical protein B0J16DRAFT_405894 [Fusarium flagelliforme]